MVVAVEIEVSIHCKMVCMSMCKYIPIQSFFHSHRFCILDRHVH